MAFSFPRDPVVELFFDRWRDVTADVRQSSPISITHGRKDWATRPAPATCTFTLDDGPEGGDGDYDPTNPMGQWFDYFTRALPARVAWRYGLDLFDRPNVASWSDSPTMGTWSSFAAGSGSVDITGNNARHLVNANSAFVATYLGDVNLRNVELYEEFTVGAFTLAGSSVEPANLMVRGHSGGDYWLLRVRITTSNQVQLQIMLTGGTTVAGPVTVLTYPTTGTDLGVRFQADGDTLRGKVWRLDQGEPLNWHVAATVVNEGLGSGWVGVRSGVAAANNNAKPFTVTVKRFDVLLRRFAGETVAFKPSSSVDHNDRTTSVEAANIRRRLLKATTPLDTALRRYIERGDAPFTVVDYWPMDQDATSATRASNILGGPDAIFVRGPVSGLGAFEYGFTTSFPSVPRAAQLSTDGRLALLITPSRFTTASGYMLTWLQKIGANCQGTVTVDQDDTSQLQLIFDQGAVKLYRNAVLIMTVTLPEDGTDTSWHMIGIGTQQQGGNIFYGLAIDAKLAESQVAGTAARPTQLAVFADSAENSTIQLSQVVTSAQYLFSFPSGAFNYSVLRDIYLGRPGELAGNRFTRLCAEESIAAVLMGDPATTPAMGAQTPIGFMALLDECVEASQGTAFDPRGARALGLRLLADTVNQSAQVTLDYAAKQVAPDFRPITDDQGAVNDVTAKRPNGGEARYQKLTGANNVNDPGTVTGAAGRAPKQVTVNVQNDGLLQDQASWRVHMGTVDAPRYSPVNITLHSEAVAADLGLMTSIMDTQVDDRIDVVNAVVRRIYDDVQLIARGYTETLVDTYRHGMAFLCEPYEPLYTGVLNDAGSRTDASDSVLSAILTSSATTFTVTGVTRWTSAAGAFPLEVRVGGEVIRIASITGGNTFNVAAAGRSINGVVKSHAAGTPVHIEQTVYIRA